MLCSALGRGSFYTDIDGCWVHRTGQSWKDLFKTVTPTTLIIDEAQIWYSYGSSDPFWLAVKEQQQIGHPGVAVNRDLQMLFISAYGERPELASSTNQGSLVGTPIDCSSEAILNFSSIRFDSEEFDELITAHNESTHPQRLSIPISKGL